MNNRPWSYYFHSEVGSIASLNPEEVTVAYDSATDTLFSDLWPLRGPTISCWVGRYEYLRIELTTRRPVGTQIEDFTRAAVSRNKRFLEVAAVCNELLMPSQSAGQMLTPELKLEVVHRAVHLAARAYDRNHGIRSLRSPRSNWMERELELSLHAVPYSVAAATEAQPPDLPEEWVIEEFNNVLNLIARQAPIRREHDFDRILQYWFSQPQGPLKQKTGQLLIEFMRSNQLDRHSTKGVSGPREELLLRLVMAG